MTGCLLPNKGEGGLSKITGQILVRGNQIGFKNDAAVQYLLFRLVSADESGRDVPHTDCESPSRDPATCRT